jgi:GR25 family glycosyltransferase involved in LPS biosynthesis
LDEAEKMAERLNLKFNHTQEDRKPGMTGFMKGEIGIWLSTVLALRKFLESDFDSLLLFEDDVIFE